ncbi:RNA polymerase sigma factor [Lacinutrix sp. 5H-3-7-4]|uniref:RNA polymerase sigma factor n=1 Tax=Lacinutrix sp. (strain 5H-3-7-4) TaxID=983544 RepID=UPI00020A3B0F|nr:sigma-70 family RNA polymerase sigma factor [Lacinutrix sp. 5H-3-7-4]AEH00986.1 RNA polymerase, sigma-24 subunit, ECF subfamily [Lacinutrix sp. 5H-3-7-4]
MNDYKILKYFINGEREKAFKQLYKLYPKIESLILSKGGNKHDASDVFQEALIILYRNLEKNNFTLTSSFYTYLYSVSRFVWSDIQKKEAKIVFNSLNENEESILETIKEEKRFKLAEQAFSELGERCRQLLLLFYHKRSSFKDIAKMMQFSSDKIAKNQKYKCLSKARAIYKNQVNNLS